MLRCAGCLWMATFCWLGTALPDESTRDPLVRDIRMDVFVRSDRDSAERVADYVAQLEQRVDGLAIHIHDLVQDRSQLAKLTAITKAAGRDKLVVPAFHCCDRTYFGFMDAARSGPEIERLFTADIYTRPSCLRCQDLKVFLPSVAQRWPAIRFRFYDVDSDARARTAWEALCRGSGVPPGLPTIDFARRVIIGFQGVDVTGAQLEALIEKVSGTSVSKPNLEDHSHLHLLDPPAVEPFRPAVTFVSTAGNQLSEGPASTGETEDFDLWDLPEEADVSETGVTDQESELLVDETAPDAMNVPFLGRLRVQELGLPLFTIAVGLVDGFNPCAMWVLVFLLSVLVNIKDRRKILIIAGTFVVVSGLAYFAFMAAWLNLFLLVGIARPVQIFLGLLALFIGIVNIKDFFAFKQGFSLSISDEHKPGLYRRVRGIVNAKHLTVALGGAVVLAIVVNMIELLCTAGLPALYTQILTLQQLPAWQNYLYLGLYITAYMFDDAVLVAIVVTTLSHRRLQEREGRWLKLLSGLVIFVLGLVMLLRPDWLQLGHT